MPDPSVLSLPEIIAGFYRAVVPQPADVDVAAMMRRTVDARPVERHAAHFRPSQLNNPYACHRRAALMRMEGVYTDRQREDPDKILLMEEGTVLHHYVQTELLGPTGALFGHWRCKSCRRIRHEFRTLPGEYCDGVVGVRGRDDETFDPRDEVACADAQRRLAADGEAPWEYVEMTLRHVELGLTGHVDGVLIDRADPRCWYTLELKTTGPGAVRGLDEVKLTRGRWPTLPPDLENAPALLPTRFGLPKAYHVNQAATYSALLLRDAEAGRVPLSPSGYRGTLIVYLNRDGLGVRAFVRRNSDAALAAARTTIEAINAVLARADLAPRPDPVDDARRVDANRRLACELSMSCRDRNDDRALRCPWRTAVCFPYKQSHKNKLEYLV